MARRYTPDRRARLVFVAVLAIWVVMPVLLTRTVAQDALPFITAGDIAHDHPRQVYNPHMSDLWDLPPVFARKSCALAPAGTDCDAKNVAFVSPPQALPMGWLLGRLGATLGELVLRLVAAGSLAAGMWLLWGKLAHRTPQAGIAMAASALLLTPMVMVPVSLGQNAPIMFLSACLGLAATDGWGRRSPWVAVLLVAAVSFKVFPIALGLVLVWQRRTRVIAWALGLGVALSAAALAVGPSSLYRQFWLATRRVTSIAAANAYNGSIAGAVHTISPVVADAGAFTAVLLAAELAAIACSWFKVVRHHDADVQWAWAWLAVLLFVPLLWWHYLFVALAAVAIALAARPRLTDRMMWGLPGLSAVTALISVPYANSHPSPVAQAAFLVAVLVLVPLVLARDARVTAAGRRATPAPPVPAPAGR